MYGDYEGGFSVKNEWKGGVWSKIDAILVALGRFYLLFFIIGIVLSVIGVGLLLPGSNTVKEGFSKIFSN